MDDEVRGAEMLSHDLIDDASIWTPEIELLTQTVANAMRLDQTGIIVPGHPRVGKTKAIGHLMQVLPEQVSQPIYALHWVTPQGTIPSDNDLLQEYARQSGCNRFGGKKTTHVRSELIRFIVGEAARITARRVLLAIDEAQQLDDLCFGQIVHIYNELEARSFKPFVLLVGQPELALREGQWLERGQLQFIGRFACKTHPFSGIRLKDLEAVLECFDDESDGAEQCPAHRTSPSAYLEGWRVKELAPLIVQAIKTICLQQGTTAEIRIPMQFLRSSLLGVLHHIRQSRKHPREVDLEIVIQCIVNNNFGKVLQQYAKAVR